MCQYSLHRFFPCVGAWSLPFLATLLALGVLVRGLAHHATELALVALVDELALLQAPDLALAALVDELVDNICPPWT